MSLKETKTIVFDYGNTLLMNPFPDVMKLKAENFALLFGNHRIIESPDDIVSAWAESNRNINYEYITHFSQEEEIIQDFLKKMGLNGETRALLGPELLSEYRHGMPTIIHNDPRTEEVRQTLAALAGRGCRLGVFSNDRDVGLNSVLGYMGIRGLFDYVETSEALQIEKPDAAVFRHILDYFKLPPGQVTYVGDDPARDVDPAKEAGMNAVLYIAPSGYQQPWIDYNVETKHEPDARIDRFSQLINIFK